jgi:recombinational DNA repair ATPase RecF
VDDEMYLDDGLALTKKASSIKVAVYRLVKERRELLEKRGTIPGAEFEKELERIEKLIAVKGYEIASLRRKFVEFMEEWDPEMELRTRFNQRKNPMEDEIEDD